MFRPVVVTAAALSSSCCVRQQELILRLCQAGTADSSFNLSYEVSKMLGCYLHTAS